MLGIGDGDAGEMTARLTCDLEANDERQDHMRVSLSQDAEGNLTAAPFLRQDSAMISILSKADGLLIRPPLAPAAKAGDPATVIPLVGRRAW